jgi:hypothetical protein
VQVETLDKIEQLVKDANAVQILPAPGEPAHVYYLREGTMVKRVEADPAIIFHAASTMETLADKAADALQVEGYAAGSRSDVQAWVDRSGVVLLLDATRRNRVTYPLTVSDQINAFTAMKGTAYTQKDLIFLLRTTFRDCLGLAGDIIPILRTVKFKDHLSGESNIGHGKASIGKSLMTEITGTGNLPEYVVLSVPVFAQAGVQAVRATVECALEPDAATQTFRLIPLPGAIERAIGDGEQQVAAKLHGLLDERKANGVGVFMGKP